MKQQLRVTAQLGQHQTGDHHLISFTVNFFHVCFAFCLLFLNNMMDFTLQIFARENYLTLNWKF